MCRSQIRADNKMLRELKAQVAKLAQAVEKSIPIIAETLEAIRNHMIFTRSEERRVGKECRL